LLAANILKMYARMHPACIPNAIWMASSTVIPQLASVFIESTTGGYSEPILKQQGDAFFVMGRPVIITEKCPTLGAKGDLILVDWSQYALGLRKEISIERSNAPGWTEDATDWRTIIRLDGQGKWNAPVTPVNGDTLSWCVVLQAR
jgi:HK97 family phage major capsid protein